MRRTSIALTLATLAALPVFCLHSRPLAFASARKDARLQSKDLKQRTTALCRAMGTADPTVGEPQFVVQTYPPQTLRGARRLWVVDCLAGEHYYSVLFNDLTGNIESVYSDGLADSGHAASGGVAISQGAIVEGAVRRLKDLQMVPKDTRIVLSERPQCNREGRIWRMTWKVLRPEATRPYEVRMVLNGYDARLVMVVNCQELGCAARN